MSRVEELFNSRKGNGLYNTSYPLHPSDWKRWKVDYALPFNDVDDISFYIHIPFCQNLCKFCEYIRFKKSSSEVEDKYLDILDHDMSMFIEKSINSETVLRGFDIGGGTPTALGAVQFNRLLDIAADHVSRINKAKDFLGSIEATFNTIDEDKIRIIGAHKKVFSRISFGLQSINASFLKDNNRSNGPLKRMLNVIDLCRQHGIGTINIDLMYGFEHQSYDDIRETVKVLSLLMPEHLTVYELRTNMLNNYPVASANQRYRQYSCLYEQITDLGYKGQYGRNTFSLKNDYGLSSYLQYRMIENGAYKGFGIAAQSKNNFGLSYNVGKNGETLAESLEKGTFEGNGDCYILSKREQLAKYMAISGYCGFVDLSVMEDILQANPMLVFKDIIDFLLANGYIYIEGNMLKITQKGFKYYGAVISLFYEDHQQ